MATHEPLTRCCYFWFTITTPSDYTVHLCGFPIITGPLRATITTTWNAIKTSLTSLLYNKNNDVGSFLLCCAIILTVGPPSGGEESSDDEEEVDSSNNDGGSLQSERTDREEETYEGKSALNEPFTKVSLVSKSFLETM